MLNCGNPIHDYQVSISISQPRAGEGPPLSHPLHSGGRPQAAKAPERKGSWRKGRNPVNPYPLKVTNRENTHFALTSQRMLSSLQGGESIIGIPRARVGGARGDSHRRLGEAVALARAPCPSLSLSMRNLCGGLRLAQPTQERRTRMVQ